MLYKIWKELNVRIKTISIAYILILTITTLYINELIIILLEPIKKIHEDWYNNILYNLITHMFTLWDKEQQQQNFENIESIIEYLPTYEITIKSTILNATITKITIQISIWSMILMLWYHYILFTIPSLFTK